MATRTDFGEHERAFTLATCEQALVLVAKGLDLDRGSWTLYANEPDLDAVLAIWILLNHRRVTQLGDDAQQVLFPLVRLEGAIDAGGTETAAFCGLAEPALGESRARLEHLYRREQTLRVAQMQAEAHAYVDPSRLAQVLDTVLDHGDANVQTITCSLSRYSTSPRSFGQTRISSSSASSVTTDLLHRS